MRESNMQHFMPKFFSYRYTNIIYIHGPLYRTSNSSIFKFVRGDSIWECKHRRDWGIWNGIRLGRGQWSEYLLWEGDLEGGGENMECVFVWGGGDMKSLLVGGRVVWSGYFKGEAQDIEWVLLWEGGNQMGTSRMWGYGFWVLSSGGMGYGMGTCRGWEYRENTWWGGGGGRIWSEY